MIKKHKEEINTSKESQKIVDNNNEEVKEPLNNDLNKNNEKINAPIQNQGNNNNENLKIVKNKNIKATKAKNYKNDENIRINKVINLKFIN